MYKLFLSIQGTSSHKSLVRAQLCFLFQKDKKQEVSVEEGGESQMSFPNTTEKRCTSGSENREGAGGWQAFICHTGILLSPTQYSVGKYECRTEEVNLFHITLQTLLEERE